MDRDECVLERVELAPERLDHLVVERKQVLVLSLVEGWGAHVGNQVVGDLVPEPMVEQGGVRWRANGVLTFPCTAR